MGSVVVDTSVVIALLDPSDGHHTTATAAYLSRRWRSQFILSAVVLSECLVAISRYGSDQVDLRRRAIRSGFGPVRAVDEPVAVAAAALRATHPSLRAPDAFILATAMVDEADEVLTCDRRWAEVDTRVVVLD